MRSSQEQREAPSRGYLLPPSQDLVRHARLLLLTQYSSRLSPRAASFSWPPPWLLLHVQPFLHADILGLSADEDEVLIPSQRDELVYQKSFLKVLISRIEAAIQWAVGGGADRDDWEVESLLLSHYACLMALPSRSHSSNVTQNGGNPMDSLSAALPYTHHSAPAERHLSYLYPLPDDRGQTTLSPSLTSGWGEVRVFESSALVGAGTTALKTWEASLRLASHLLCHRSNLIAAHARVLELGSGTGTLSVLIAAIQRAARSGARLCATDLSSIVRGKLRKTFELNGIETSTTTGSQVQLLDLDWVELQQEIEEGGSKRRANDGQMPSTQAVVNLAPTLILAADVIFDPSIIGPLVTTIKFALEAGAASCSQVDPEALIASTVRNPSTYSRFLAQLDRAGLVSEEVVLDRCVIEAPLSGEVQEVVQPIVAFSSSHDEHSEGTVTGLRITLPSPR